MKSRRASSEGRGAAKSLLGTDRSRSPERDNPQTAPVEVTERVIPAPIYVEPGADGDKLGVAERDRKNVQKLFTYLNHVAKVVNVHADTLDYDDQERRRLELGV